MKSYTTEILKNGGAVQGYSLTFQRGARQRTFYAVPRPTDFATFLVHAGDIWDLTTLDNSNFNLHNNTVWDFAEWSAENLPAPSPVTVFVVDRAFGAVWPASPNIAAAWNEIKLAHFGGSNFGVLYRAVESRDLEWARRIRTYPGGQSQRITELYAVKSVDQTGIPYPFPLHVPENGVTAMLQEKAPTGNNPTWDAVMTALASANAVTYACTTRWAEMIAPTPVPRFVEGVTTASDVWLDTVPPVDGQRRVRVTQLEILNDESGSLFYRFGAAGDELGPVTTAAPAVVSIPDGETFTIEEKSRIQVKMATAGSYRIRYRLA